MVRPSTMSFEAIGREGGTSMGRLVVEARGTAAEGPVVQGVASVGNSDPVLLIASVTDADGVPVSGLRATDFTIHATIVGAGGSMVEIVGTVALSDVRAASNCELGALGSDGERQFVELRGACSGRSRWRRRSGRGADSAQTHDPPKIRAERRRFGPRVDRSQAFSRPWSASIGLFACCSTVCRAEGTSSSSTRGNRGAVGGDLGRNRACQRPGQEPPRRGQVAQQTAGRRWPGGAGRSPGRGRTVRATFINVSSTNLRSPRAWRPGRAASMNSG